MEPMLLRPAGKDYLWGGEKLREEYGKEINDREGVPLHPLAETWECSVHPDGPSTVASGEYKSELLSQLLSEKPEYLGSKVTDQTLPVLIKFIDAKRDLSVQVHPDDEYARTHELTDEGLPEKGKTEMWYVLEAEEGASLVCGFNHDVNPGAVNAAIEKGTLTRYLKKTPVHKGDVFFITPGTIHAIGGGILLAEIQESSNVTYRVYDYDRIDPKTGKKRELHVKKALEVLDYHTGAELRQKPRKVNYYPGCSRELLCRCRYFETERIIVSLGFSFTVRESSFQVLLVTDGEGGIGIDEMRRPLRFQKGDCIFIPAGTGRCHVIGTCSLLKIRC